MHMETSYGIFLVWKMAQIRVSQVKETIRCLNAKERMGLAGEVPTFYSSPSACWFPPGFLLGLETQGYCAQGHWTPMLVHSLPCIHSKGHSITNVSGNPK